MNTVPLWPCGFECRPVGRWAVDWQKNNSSQGRGVCEVFIRPWAKRLKAEKGHFCYNICRVREQRDTFFFFSSKRRIWAAVTFDRNRAVLISCRCLNSSLKFKYGLLKPVPKWGPCGYGHASEWTLKWVHSTAREKSNAAHYGDSL